MIIDISICDLQLLSIRLPLVFNFHAGFDALSMYDEVSTRVMFYSVDIHLLFFFRFWVFFFSSLSVQLLNVTSKTLKTF